MVRLHREDLPSATTYEKEVFEMGFFSNLFGKKEPTAPNRTNAPMADSKEYTAIAEVILEGLGGKQNIVSCDNCSNRLKLEVKNRLLVDEITIKSAGAYSVIRPGATGVWIIMGSNGRFVADALKKLIK